MSHNLIAAKDFSKSTLKTLADRSIFVIGAQAAPLYAGDWSLSSVLYAVADNGTHRLLSHGDVIALAV